MAVNRRSGCRAFWRFNVLYHHRRNIIFKPLRVIADTYCRLPLQSCYKSHVDGVRQCRVLTEFDNISLYIPRRLLTRVSCRAR